MARIIKLKIELSGIKPKIWRQFLVRDDIKFQDLHEIIQVVIGWENYHMYEFSIGENTITSGESFNSAEGVFKQLFRSPEFMKMVEQQGLKKGSASLDINKVNKILEEERNKKSEPMFTMDTKLNKLIKSKSQKFLYLYDFGDNWEHLLKVEGILDENQAGDVPACLNGERACPPEDCGSVPGYYDLARIKKDKKHPYYKERIAEWLGEDFDFELFDIDAINKELKKIRRSLK